MSLHHGLMDSVGQSLWVDMASTNESVFAVDAEGRVVYISHGLEVLLGYPADDALGCHCDDVLHLVTGQGPCTCGTCMRGSSDGCISFPGRFDVVARTHGGVDVPLRVKVWPARNAVGASFLVHVVRPLLSGEPRLNGAEIAEHPTTPEIEARAGGVQSVPRNSRTDQQIALTRREREVLGLLATGLSTAAIATSLGISPLTARNHVTSIIDKLGATSRLQAVILAARMGLIT